MVLDTIFLSKFRKSPSVRVHMPRSAKDRGLILHNFLLFIVSARHYTLGNWGAQHFPNAKIFKTLHHWYSIQSPLFCDVDLNLCASDTSLTCICVKLKWTLNDFKVLSCEVWGVKTTLKCHVLNLNGGWNHPWLFVTQTLIIHKIKLLM